MNENLFLNKSSLLSIISVAGGRRTDEKSHTTKG